MAADLHNITSPVAKVSTSDPTYTDGDVAGLSLTTTGGLRVSGTSAGGATTVTGNPVTYTNRSGTITAGGVAQVLMASNTSRGGFIVQNQSTGDLWISSLGTAAAVEPSIWLPPGSYYEPPSTGVPTAAISIYGGTTGQAFAAREW